MIAFNSITDFKLTNVDAITEWVRFAVLKEEFTAEDINYIFCDDGYLLELNIKHLKHNTLTDIISFNDSLGRLISGDIFISIDRVRENATKFNVSFDDELHRVMIHGILHFCKYNDKTAVEKKVMREKEDYYLSLREL